jgi:hypothetical protein
MNKPLSQAEAYKVADWLKRKGIEVGAVLINIWKKRPSDIALEFNVQKLEVAKAAGREDE